MTVASTDLNLLVALTALLEEGNVTHAGLRIGMSQPAMSGALGRLRRHFKDDLLVRVGRDYELTPLARELLPAAKESLRLVEFALRLSREFDPGASDRTFRFAVSDYAVAVINRPLMSLVQEIAPGVRIDFDPIPAGIHLSDNGLLSYDFLVGPLGYGFRGESEVLFRDRFVCVADPSNERLEDGRLTMRDLADLPHVVPSFGMTMTPVDRVLDELGVRRPAHMTVQGWLPIPFAVAGTDMVALVPERLAHQVAGTAGVAVVEPPFGRVEMVEAIWWHPTRSTDAGHTWLRSVLEAVTLGLGADEELAELATSSREGGPQMTGRVRTPGSPGSVRTVTGRTARLPR